MASTAGLVIRCKAAVAWEVGKPLVIEELEVAPPKAMEVRVKILFTSLCHTDVYFWEAKCGLRRHGSCAWRPRPSRIHWRVHGVKALQVGGKQHVQPPFLRINTDRGEMLSDGQPRFSKNGQPIYHFVGSSTFSEYTVIHMGCLAKINPAAPLDKACVLSCVISKGLGATLNVAKPKKGSSVAVFGLGAVGLAVAEGTRISGASRITGVDLNASRFEEDKKFGVTEFENPKDHNKPAQQVIEEMTDGGVDRSIERTGNINAMISAFECVHDGWGGCPQQRRCIQDSSSLLNERTLKATFFGNYKPRSDLPSVVEKYMNKELELEKFITHDVGFSDINKDFDIMLKGEGRRCLIRMDE